MYYINIHIHTDYYTCTSLEFILSNSEIYSINNDFSIVCPVFVGVISDVTTCYMDSTVALVIP